MKLLQPVLVTLFFALAILVATMSRDPYLSFMRPWLMIGLTVLGAGAALISAFFLGRRRPSWALRFVGIGGVALLIVTATVEIRFQVARSRVFSAQGEHAQNLGRYSRHIITGYRDADVLRQLLERVELGGIFITSWNIHGRSMEQVRAEIDSFQAIQRRHGRPPLWVAADQEGGLITRLSPPLQTMPSLAQVAGGDDWRERVVDYGREKAEALKAIGVNFNFSPVVDLKNSHVSPTIDLHSRIADRAIAAQPERVAEVSAVYVDSLWQGGIMSSAKHFPGLGAINADTHLFAGHTARTRDELMGAEWLPFARLARDGKTAVMVGHVFVDRIDADNLASASQALIAGDLRGRLGHTGLVVTDDVCMGPVVYGDGGMASHARRSLAAGVDYLLITWDPEAVFPLLVALAGDAGSSREEAALRKSDERIARVRAGMASL